MSAKRSAPTPVLIGSTRFSTAAVATAASTALPPLSMIRSPAWAASGWLVVTMAWGAMTSARLCARQPTARSPRTASHAGALRSAEHGDMSGAVCAKAQAGRRAAAIAAAPQARCKALAMEVPSNMQGESLPALTGRLAERLYQPRDQAKEACGLLLGHPNASLLDHLVGNGQQRWRHRKIDRSRGMQVDDELEFGRLHHRQVGRLLALKDAPGIDPDLAILVQDVRAVAHQAAGFGKDAIVIDRRHNVARCENRELEPAVVERRTVIDQNALETVFHEACKGRVDLTIAARLESLDVEPDGGCRRLHGLETRLAADGVRIDQHGKTLGVWDDLVQQPEP